MAKANEGCLAPSLRKRPFPLLITLHGVAPTCRRWRALYNTPFRVRSARVP